MFNIFSSLQVSATNRTAVIRNSQTNDQNSHLVSAKTIDEKRFLIIAKISDKYWSTIITYRNEKVRIISVRRSRKEEIEIYES